MLLMIPGNSCLDCQTHSRRIGDTHLEVVTFALENIYVIVCYKHPRFSSSVLLEVLQLILISSPGPKVLIGDLNMGANHDRLKLNDFFSKFGMRPNLGTEDVTTELGSQIDVCFSNVSELLVSVAETYYSYHKALCISLN